MKVTKEQLRNFYINYHGFYEFFELDAQSAIERIFERIKSVQFDPLNVVGRNAELVLFSRNRNVTPQTLYDNLYRKRTLVDGWDKMMCIYPSADFGRFKFVRERMQGDYNGVINWRKQTDSYAHMDEIYSFIESNGPVLVTDIPSPKTNDGRWGPTKIAGVCCEYLWFGGKIVVAYKKGVIKAYDTAEKVFGAAANINAFDCIDEFMRWYVLRRISAVGALWNKNGGGWLGPFLGKGDERTPVINELVERGDITPVEVDGEKAEFYIPSGAEKFFVPTSAERAALIAPLDNLIWDRKLISKVFGFDYSWEVYVPASKRKYGYYVLPVLLGNRFIGRIEPKQVKAGEKLAVKSVWYEPDYTPGGDDIDKVSDELSRLARFLNTEADDGIKDVLYSPFANIKHL